MAKDKSKKKNKKNKAVQVDDVGSNALTIVIDGITDDQLGYISALLNTGGGTPAPSKSKASKKDAIDTTAVETDDDSEDEPESVTYTEKQLAKKERAELVDLCHSLGLTPADTKSKRVPTLVGLILTEQERLASGGDESDDEFTADDDSVDDEWDEDVPPAEDAPKKKGKKGKKNKK